MNDKPAAPEMAALSRQQWQAGVEATADNKERKRRKAGGNIEQFAHLKSKGTGRAIRHFRQKKQAKFARTASRLREYHKIVKQEGFQAGHGASRKRHYHNEHNRENDIYHDNMENEDETTTKREDALSHLKQEEEEAKTTSEQEKRPTKRNKRIKSDPFAKAKSVAQKQKEQRAQLIVERNQHQELVKDKLLKRRQHAKQMGSRTKKGQPLMKHVIDNLLDKIQNTTT